MKVERIHPITKEINTLDLDINEEEIDSYMRGVSVQEAFPRINADEREFIISGLLPGEYDDLHEKVGGLTKEEKGDDEEARVLREDHRSKMKIQPDQDVEYDKTQQETEEDCGDDDKN